MSAMQGFITLNVSDRRSRGPSLIGEIRTLWRDLARAIFDSYQPERHYMRGPGPACAAKRGLRG